MADADGYAEPVPDDDDEGPVDEPDVIDEADRLAGKSYCDALLDLVGDTIDQDVDADRDEDAETLTE